EVFTRGKDTEDGRSTTLVNLGGYYKFTPDFNLLFSAGHSVGGETHMVAYVGLWWAFGGDGTEEQKTGLLSGPNHWASLP
ncbi:MAG TPA: hypothetical protein VKD22_13145, partial [Ramlibacter sp.]|nr:hypothetical protein [Ramlibacter sp.]